MAILVAAPSARAESVNKLLTAARAALSQGRAEEALHLADKAVAADAQSVPAYYLRGILRDGLRRHAEAVADFDKVIQLDPRAAEAYDRRGSTHFMLGNVRASLADFDRFLELKPAERPGHWRRGITCYYVGQFDEGKKQFEGYEKVDTNDVENAVWHFLCNARLVGIDKARAAILKIGNDRRVPMMQVYALYAGKVKPADVLAAAMADDPPAPQLNQRLFYAHLYLGLYYEVLADRDRTLEHLEKAEGHKIGHYMWDVARVHRQLLRKKSGPGD
jgi:lipoprotein NlpI